MVRLAAYKLQGIELNAPNASELGALITSPAPVILDIGCNDAPEAVVFSNMFPEAKIYCFEPDDRAAQRFMKSAGRKKGLRLFRTAVSNIDGETTFFQSDGSHPYRPAGWDLSGSIREPHKHKVIYPWVSFPRSTTVKTTRLDTWAETNYPEGFIDLVWMDVQGAEADVFEGAKNTFLRTRYIFTEYDNRELYKGQSSLSNLLRCRPDFELVARYPNDVLLKNKRL